MCHFAEECGHFLEKECKRDYFLLIMLTPGQSFLSSCLVSKSQKRESALACWL